MIHCGGFMTMSRTAIRPWQTSLLIEHNVLPISIDYRLCLKVNLVDGPMEDARDALTWVRNNLPTICFEARYLHRPGENCPYRLVNWWSSSYEYRLDNYRRQSRASEGRPELLRPVKL